ncbi:MAG: RraA family protein [Rhodospirillales bacterium]|jgi:regulator of RNase E activity RraA|nr:RraA family protein [Rhodospirillales bacterium]MDP6883164.1 RraA family protein [Rhodospirillales bacterium]
MFKINDLPPQIDQATLDKLAKAETATIGHFLHAHFMDPAISAVIPGRRVAGTAVTLRIPGPDSALLHHVIGLVRPGDFLVIDRCGDRKHAAWGGVVAFAAKNAGVVGGVIDGYATDFAELREYDMPVWCLGSTPITTKKLALGGGFNVSVSCGGVAVNPGDAVLADENGVLVLPPAMIDYAADRALELQDREGTTLKRIKNGEKLGDISGSSAMIAAALKEQDG